MRAQRASRPSIVLPYGEIHPQAAAELMTFPKRQHPACASSTLSETTSKLSCFFLDVFDESRNVQSVGQRMMEIDEER